MPRSLRWPDPENFAGSSDRRNHDRLSVPYGLPRRAGKHTHESFIPMRRTGMADAAVVGRGARSDNRSHAALGGSLALG